ncbi:MAG: RHS repeat protein [Caldisericia bacterium]|nr:RHS repeat protein [Caldisericia bacterium]
MKANTTTTTTVTTYYYHYDLHGNVIRVTNSSGTTVIQYTYDQLGTIVAETNANSIYNPFTYMGEAQIIHDDEFDTSGTTPKTGLYSSGSGYYNPHTGTFLGGSGAPTDMNPVSNSPEAFMARVSRPLMQAAEMAQEAQESTVTPIIDVSSKNKLNTNLESQMPEEENNSDDNCGPSFTDDTDAPPQMLPPITYKVSGDSSTTVAISDSKSDDKKKDGPESMGGQEGDTTVITDEKGKVVARVDKNGELHIYDKAGKEITDKKKKQDRWNEICKNVDKGKGKARFFDSDGKPCSGSIGMKMSDGTWTGIFVAYNSEIKDKSKQFTTSVRTNGSAADFGLKNKTTYGETNDYPGGTSEIHDFMYDEQDADPSKVGEEKPLEEGDFSAGDFITTRRESNGNTVASAGRYINGSFHKAVGVTDTTIRDSTGRAQSFDRSKNYYTNPLLKKSANGVFYYDLNNGRLKKIK